MNKILKEAKINDKELPRVFYYDFTLDNDNLKSFCKNLKESDKDIIDNIPATLLADIKTDEALLNELYPLSDTLKIALKPIRDELDKGVIDKIPKVNLSEATFKTIGEVDNILIVEKILNEILSAIVSLNRKEAYIVKFVYTLDSAIKELLDKYSLFELDLDSIDKAEVSKIKKYIRSLLDISGRADIKDFLKSVNISSYSSCINSENFIIIRVPSKKKPIEKKIKLTDFPKYMEKLEKTINTIKDITDKLSDNSLLVPAVYSPVFFDITKFVNITSKIPIANKGDENRALDLYILDKHNKLYMLKGYKFSLLTEKLIMKICISYNERNEIKLNIIEFMEDLGKITTPRNIERFKADLKKEIISLSKCSLVINNSDYDSVLGNDYIVKGNIWSVSLSKRLFNSLKGDYKKELFSQYHKNLFKINTPIAYEIGKKLVYNWNLNKYLSSKTFKTDTTGKRTNINSVKTILEDIIDTTPERIYKNNTIKKDIGTFIINPFIEALEKLKEAEVIIDYKLASGTYEEKLKGNLEYTVNEAPDLIIEREKDYIDI